MLLFCICLINQQVFDEKNPLDDDEKPSDSWSGPFNKLNWMKVRFNNLPQQQLSATVRFADAAVTNCLRVPLLPHSDPPSILHVLH
jgi:hypothetical protein